MSASDQARVTVSVAAPPEIAFEVFTTEIDLLWRRGLRYRHFGGERALIAIDPREGGRVFESTGGDGPVYEIGCVLNWQPPSRLRFEWRLSNFAPSEHTEVEVLFEADGTGTRVTETHSGWNAIRPDHPARHGEASAIFLRRLGLWWGGQLSVYRLHAAGRMGPDR
jgi:uncharacterized protein YndB with AHSA1/START domain